MIVCAEAYIAAVRQRDEQAASQMSVQQVVGSEATFTLGALGFPEAFDALLAETNAEDTFRKVNGAIALSGTGAELLADPQVRAAYLEGGAH